MYLYDKNAKYNENTITNNPLRSFMLCQTYVSLATNPASNKYDQQTMIRQAGLFIFNPPIMRIIPLSKIQYAKKWSKPESSKNIDL